MTCVSFHPFYLLNLVSEAKIKANYNVVHVDFSVFVKIRLVCLPILDGKRKLKAGDNVVHVHDSAFV